jgi:hypothetical protein
LEKIAFAHPSDYGFQNTSLLDGCQDDVPELDREALGLQADGTVDAIHPHDGLTVRLQPG